ncbi:hypothetical protein GCM10008107_24960 [Psychrosphaera saromensis]|uniref:Protein CR006 P-loop domain-containing protein n=1 Tax=Psychrosphaera saromensis TaxID=716813 RepID=A0A2S7UWZ1_9GAMM|nr:AAA family ATPase [Psychrosphaera saromensis]PQJ54289.1 hypothetical protein BTO11_11905 [Psychrosphaera saromensis]GHB74518.1 hypothetical protein GCM10008107_24960 [Psychrosphaera saromensis]GLQ12609.1 hypothetical protein GCM10007917_00640 [Psychrosphaera saromensis]
MIESYELKSVASYDAVGIKVTGLKPINFFYGANGCGKTTSSNYLAQPFNEKFTQCSVRWVADQALKTLVYNKEFREANFVGSNDIAGVFSLGQASAEEIALIQSKKEELDNFNQQQKQQKTTLDGKESELEKQTANFQNVCWAVYKQYQDDFNQVLKGSIGSKKAFMNKVITESNADRSLVELKEHASLLNKAETLLGERPSTFPRIPLVTSTNISGYEQNDIWEKVIVGKSNVDIAALITHLNSNDWVSMGQQFIEDETCPFCQKETIDNDFKAQLGAFFDETFVENSQRVSLFEQSYKKEVDRLLNHFEQIQQTEKSNPDSKLDIDGYDNFLSILQSKFKSNHLIMCSKVEKVSMQIDIDDTHIEIEELIALIATANITINSHNQLATNYDSEISTFTAEVWRFLVVQVKTEIAEYKKKSKGTSKAIAGISKLVKKRQLGIVALDAEIKELSKNMTSVQPAVDEINRMLKAYGFTNFSIVPSTVLPNHYSIERENGDLALATLSEGEVTFITFLYFIQLANGALTQESVTEDRVLVIDDPISSLDSNVLYIVSAIIKKLTREIKEGSSIKQLLLFTHNVYFHKEASYQGGRSNGCNKTHFWILRKANNITSIQPYNDKNPISSSYELLWREIKDRKPGSSITIQNTMRRILENYFKILGDFSDEDIVEKFESVEEQQICRSLLYWINDGSHCLPDDLFIQEVGDSTEQFVGVFKNVFNYSGHLAHYQMMMGEEVTIQTSNVITIENATEVA